MGREPDAEAAPGRARSGAARRRASDFETVGFFMTSLPEAKVIRGGVAGSVRRMSWKCEDSFLKKS